MKQLCLIRLAAATIFAAFPAAAAIDPAAAASIFQQAKTICQRDNGALWGHTLCGPILIVDPNDNSIVANQADAKGILHATGPVFTGILPSSEILANTTVEWSGTRWSELLWPIYDDADKRHVVLAHELFHRIQPDLNIQRRDGDNRHLDSLDGRYFLQLEWRALARALQASDPAARRAAIADAILFRSQRYRLFPGAAAEEGALESNEGVAEYTGVKLGLETPEARTRFALQDLSAFVPSPSFVRSFAYATGPAYGLLLDQADPQWLTKLPSGQRFDQLLSSALHLSPPAFGDLKSREAVYDGPTLRAFEMKRDQDRTARLSALKAKLVDGPVLTLPLNKSSYQFNPQTLQPLGDIGTVYPTMRLTDSWGTLDVAADALLDKQMSVAAVSARDINIPALTGNGWRLTLKEGWSIQPGLRQGDFIVKQTAAR